jgi:hypothetical protein
LQFRLALLSACLALAGVLAGAPCGILGIAAGVAISVVIGNLAYVAAAMREVRVSPRELLAAIAPALASAAVMACGVIGLRALLPATLPTLATLVLAAGAGMSLYAAAMRVLAPATVAAALLPFRRQRPPVAERIPG